METVKGVLFFETFSKIKKRCLILEDPKKKISYILTCNIEYLDNNNRKRGVWKFKKYKFYNLDPIRITNKTINEYFVMSDLTLLDIKITDLMDIHKKTGKLDFIEKWID